MGPGARAGSAFPWWRAGHGSGAGSNLTLRPRAQGALMEKWLQPFSLSPCAPSRAPALLLVLSKPGAAGASASTAAEELQGTQGGPMGLGEVWEGMLGVKKRDG